MAEPIEMQFEKLSRMGPMIGCMNIDATWRIRLNRPRAAVMRPYVKLFFDHLLW